ncbi:hypothetical protein PPE_05675 [Paenibacillus polymyxa E681]|nr:hypothetical protein PPE_05675 [Paenibacillus polymyxa E681]
MKNENGKDKLSNEAGRWISEKRQLWIAHILQEEETK